MGESHRDTLSTDTSRDGQTDRQTDRQTTYKQDMNVKRLVKVVYLTSWYIWSQSTDHGATAPTYTLCNGVVDSLLSHELSIFSVYSKRIGKSVPGSRPSTVN